jgi:hypothetical protein
MPKAIDLRVPGLSFHDAIRRLASSPPPPESKPVKKAASKSKRTKR